MSSPIDALLDTHAVDGLLDDLRSVPVRFTMDGSGTSRAQIEVSLGRALEDASLPNNAMAVDVPVSGDVRRPAWVPPGSTLTLWVASAGASFHMQVLDAVADTLMVGLAGVTSCIVIPSARKKRLDVFPDLPAVSAIAIEEMTEAEREEFVEYTEGTSSQIGAGKNVWVPAGSFVFLEWRERGALLVARRPRPVTAIETDAAERDGSAPYTMRDARARAADEQWDAADSVRLTHGVPLYTRGADSRVRVMLVQSAVAVIDQSFDESSLRFRILDVLLERRDTPVPVQDLRRLATDAELSHELSWLRRDGWITRVAATR